MEQIFRKVKHFYATFYNRILHSWNCGSGLIWSSKTSSFLTDRLFLVRLGALLAVASPFLSFDNGKVVYTAAARQQETNISLKDQKMVTVIASHPQGFKWLPSKQVFILLSPIKTIFSEGSSILGLF